MKSVYDVIEQPLITEKSVSGRDMGKYSFRVKKDANKIEIAKAVEQVFNVKVLSVNTMTVKGKKKRVGRHPAGMTADWKKAIVTLAPGNNIEIFEGM
ncbi:MAG: 50S ribosomal protein L23 [Armatimonadota bacterium]|jgi:large subunit ribosomal protein L23|nr:50S ribosomal protein L23 [Armatimonadota bacterium]